jgi:hypothetical protein
MSNADDHLSKKDEPGFPVAGPAHMAEKLL